MSVKDKVIQIIAEQGLLDVADVSLTATLEELGIDSLRRGGKYFRDRRRIRHRSAV
jgi:hypothetical protein